MADENKKPSVTMKDQVPTDFKPAFSDIVDKSENLDRRSDKGIVNNKTGSSIVVRDDGQVNLSSSISSQYKLNPNGKSEEITLESVTKTNRKNYIVDDFAINNHKMNPQLWEMTDMRQIYNSNKYAAGNITMLGTVMVKAWDTELKRYVLIRRLCRVPMFYREMNVPSIPDGLKITDSTEVANTYNNSDSKSTNTNSTTADSGTEAIKSASTNGSTAKTTPAAASEGGGSASDTSTTDVDKKIEENTKNASEEVKKEVDKTTGNISKNITDSLSNITKSISNKVTAETINKSETVGKVKEIISNAVDQTNNKVSTDQGNTVTKDISEISKCLSKDLSLGITAVDSQLSSIKSDLIKQTKDKMNSTATKEEIASACKSVLAAADKAFVANKVELFKTAENIQGESENYIKSYISNIKKTGSSIIGLKSKDIYNDVYAEVKKELASSSSNISKAVSKTDLINVVRGKESIGDIAKKIKSSININAETIIKNTVLSTIMVDIEKEKKLVQAVEEKIKNFEQEEIAKVQKAIQAEINKVAEAAMKEAESIIKDKISDITKSLGI